MLDYSQKRKVRAVAYHRVTLVVLGILVLIFAHSTWVVWGKKKESDDLKRISLANVALLESRNTDIQNKIQALHTVVGVEQEIRSKFSVAKEGENMAVVVESPTATTTVAPLPPSLWQKVWHFFIK